MNKKELDLLKKVYDLEIDNNIYQGKSKLVQTMVKTGHLETVEFTIPADRSCPFPVFVTGFKLTDLGRYAYCAALKLPVV